MTSTETGASTPCLIAAVIPAYQAAPTIGDLVRRTLALVENVWVVDDGSTDGTGAEAQAAGARVLRVSENRGKGHALKLAFETIFARGFDAVITLDADGQHLPEEIPKLLSAAESGADLVIGSRAKLWSEFHPVRRASNRLSTSAISTVAGVDLDDIQSGFRYYRRRLIEATGFPETRFEAESAVIVRASRLGFQLDTTPIDLGFADGRLTSHYRPVIDSLRIFGAVTRARLSSLPRSNVRTGASAPAASGSHTPR